MHRDTETLLSAPFLNLCYPLSFLHVIPKLTLCLNNNTIWNSAHASRSESGFANATIATQQSSVQNLQKSSDSAQQWVLPRHFWGWQGGRWCKKEDKGKWERLSGPKLSLNLEIMFPVYTAQCLIFILHHSGLELTIFATTSTHHVELRWEVL